MPAAENTATARYASAGNQRFATLTSLFCVVLVLSNINATKGIEFFGVPFDGGMFLFPLAYIMGDVISEIYGLKAARKAILTGFAASLLATLTFWITTIAPAAPFYENQTAFEAVLSPVPLIVSGSLSGYLAGQFINSSILTTLKKHTHENKLWIRLTGSTGIGELVDTVIFCSFAAPAIGINSWETYFYYLLAGYAFKTAITLFLTPLTYQVIKYIKRHEPTYPRQGQECPSVS